MKINFTEHEFRSLIDMLEISEWILNTYSVGPRPKETAKYQNLMQKIFSYAKEMGFENLIEYNKELDGYYATFDYEMNPNYYMQYIEKYDEQVFWESLTRKLALRDLIAQEGEDRVNRMDRMERFEKLAYLEEWYKEEFVETGLDNLKIEILQKMNSVNH